jgi:hypothetical protein
MIHPWVARYVAAALAVGVTFLVKLEIEAWVGAGPPFLLYLPAVTVGARAGGLGPGLLATALAHVWGGRVVGAIAARKFGYFLRAFLHPPPLFLGWRSDIILSVFLK